MRASERRALPHEGPGGTLVSDTGTRLAPVEADAPSNRPNMHRAPRPKAWVSLSICA